MPIQYRLFVDTTMTMEEMIEDFYKILDISASIEKEETSGLSQKKLRI